jgi:hypothetical protein
MAIRATVVIYTKPEATGITYVKPEAIAYLDNTSINQWKYEEIPLTDLYVSVITKPLTETISILEEFNKNLSIPTVETVTILETFLKVTTFDRYINDAFTLDDVALIDKDYYGNKGNVATLLEVIGLSYTKPFTGDTCTVSDVVDVVMTFIQTLNESLLATDIYNIASNINKVETLTITELYTPQFNANKTETSTLSDSSYFEFLKNIYDTLLLIDSESNPLGTFVLNSRVINTSSSAFNVEKGNDQADSFAVSDSTDVSAGKQFTDPLSTSPSAFSDVDIFSLLKSTNDSIGFTELLTFVWAARYFTYADTATITEDLGNHLSKILQGSGEVVNINDTIDVKRVTGGVINVIPLNRVRLN